MHSPRLVEDPSLQGARLLAGEEDVQEVGRYGSHTLEIESVLRPDLAGEEAGVVEVLEDPVRSIVGEPERLHDTSSRKHLSGRQSCGTGEKRLQVSSVIHQG